MLLKKKNVLKAILSVIGTIILFSWFIFRFTITRSADDEDTFLPIIVQSGQLASTLTPTNTITPTIVLPDLIIGQPILISTPPIVAYQPLEFQVVITNSSNAATSNSFFVDVVLHPTPISREGNYVVVSSLNSNSSEIITIYSSNGFQDSYSDNHFFSSNIDIGRQVTEADESNNYLYPWTEVVVATAEIVPTPTSHGFYEIHGITRRQMDAGEWVSQPRVSLRLIDDSSTVVDEFLSDSRGYFTFYVYSSKTYSISACHSIDGEEYTGTTTGITPNNFYRIDIALGDCP